MRKCLVVLLLSTAFTLSLSAGQSTASLGTAASFAVLASSSISNTGATRVTGDLGVTQTTTVSAFPPGVVNGSMFLGDSVAIQAMSDMNAAYADLAARTEGALGISGELGGQVLTAGLYRSSAALSILAGDLVLDGRGDANAVFIMRTSESFSMAPGRRIILTGGAMAANVFWQVGGSASIGLGSAFRGTLLANQSVTLSTAATVEGRVFARTGAVIMDNNSITTPPPAISQGGVVNGASFLSPVAAGSIVSIFGSNLSFTQQSALFTPLPYTMGGSRFQVEGQATPLFYVSSSQVNIQIPWELAGSVDGQVTGTVGSATVSPQRVAMAAYAPGIFKAGATQGAVIIAGTSQLAAPISFGFARPAQRGEYISIYCTGLGLVANRPATGAAASVTALSHTFATPTVSIAGIPVQVEFSGLAPGFVGLYQVNVQVPVGTPSGDSVPVTLSIGGSTSNTVTMAVQ